MDELQSTEELLVSVSRLISEHQKSARNISKRGEAFNVFKLCGIDHYEVWHSKILAEFLSPTGSHGQGDSFLRAFFDMLKIDWDSKSARVYTEVSSKIGNATIGRLDVLIEGSDYGIVIENKLFAAEQPAQLSRYSEWLKKTYGERCRLIFLTPNGRESSTAPDGSYTRLSYLENTNKDEAIGCVDKWLNKCREIAIDAPFVRETIAQYRNHINNVINGEQGMAIDVCGLIKANPTSAEVIFNGYKNTMAGCAQELLETILDEFNVDEGCGSWSEDKDARSFNISYDAKNQGVEVAYSKDDSRIVVSLIFETKGLSSFFMGVSVDHNPTQLTDVGIKWNDAVSRFNQAHGLLGSDKFATHKYWLIWKYVVIDGMCDWNGKFFQKMKDDEDFKDRLVRKVRDELCRILVFFKVCLEWARGDKTQTLDVYIGRDGQEGGM